MSRSPNDLIPELHGHPLARAIARGQGHRRLRTRRSGPRRHRRGRHDRRRPPRGGIDLDRAALERAGFEAGRRSTLLLPYGSSPLLVVVGAGPAGELTGPPPCAMPPRRSRAPRRSSRTSACVCRSSTVSTRPRPGRPSSRAPARPVPLRRPQARPEGHAPRPGRSCSSTTPSRRRRPPGARPRVVIGARGRTVPRPGEHPPGSPHRPRHGRRRRLAGRRARPRRRGVRRARRCSSSAAAGCSGSTPAARTSRA